MLYLVRMTNQLTTTQVAKGLNIGESRLMIYPGLRCERGYCSVRNWCGQYVEHKEAINQLSHHLPPFF